MRGNFKTRTSVILRELPFGPGDRYSPDEVELGEQRLRALGLFNSVRLSFVGVEQHLNPLTVIVEIEERYDYSADLELAIGSATDNIFFVSAALIAHNVGGYGHELRLGGEVGFEVRAADAAYTVPRLYLTKKPITVRATTFLRQEDTQRLGTLFSFGGSLAFSRELARNFFASLRYDIRQVNRSVNLVRGAGHDEDLDSVKLASRTGSISAQVVWDKRNDPLLPSKGFRLSSTGQLAANAFGGTDDFVKLSATGSHFWSPTPRTLFAQGLRFDYGIPLSGVLLPAVERLYAGGDTSVRGFEEDRLFTGIVSSASDRLPHGKFEHTRRAAGRQHPRSSTTSTSRSTASDSTTRSRSRCSWTAAWSPTRCASSASPTSGTAWASPSCATARPSASRPSNTRSRSTPSSATTPPADSTSTSGSCSEPKPGRAGPAAIQNVRPFKNRFD